MVLSLFESSTLDGKLMLSCSSCISECVIQSYVVIHVHLVMHDLFDMIVKVLNITKLMTNVYFWYKAC